ncbi:MAG: hypothetical protein Q9159_005198 [Coniocarpon cinnabarinum]
MEEHYPNFNNFEKRVLGSHLLNDIERDECGRFLRLIRKSSEKAISVSDRHFTKKSVRAANHSTDGIKTNYLTPRFHRAHYYAQNWSSATLEPSTITWVCLPYFALGAYEEQEQLHDPSQHHPELTLHQYFYGDAPRKQDMEQAASILLKQEKCFLVPQLWCLVIANIISDDLHHLLGTTIPHGPSGNLFNYPIEASPSHLASGQACWIIKEIIVYLLYLKKRQFNIFIIGETCVNPISRPARGEPQYEEHPFRWIREHKLPATSLYEKFAKAWGVRPMQFDPIQRDFTIFQWLCGLNSSTSQGENGPTLLSSNNTHNRILERLHTKLSNPRRFSRSSQHAYRDCSPASYDQIWTRVSARGQNLLRLRQRSDEIKAEDDSSVRDKFSALIDDLQNLFPNLTLRTSLQKRLEKCKARDAKSAVEEIRKVVARQIKSLAKMLKEEFDLVAFAHAVCYYFVDPSLDALVVQKFWGAVQHKIDQIEVNGATAVSKCFFQTQQNIQVIANIHLSVLGSGGDSRAIDGVILDTWFFEVSSYFSRFHKHDLRDETHVFLVLALLTLDASLFRCLILNANTLA